VLDPFMGTGTTAAVAKRMGRRFIGIDINPRYVELARERVRAAAPATSRCFSSIAGKDELKRIAEAEAGSAGRKAGPSTSGRLTAANCKLP
jgi:DNA modification methylase